MSLLRKLVYPELVTLVGWAEEEGWEPGHHDAEQFWNYDPEGFLAIEEDGEFLGGGAIIKHSDQFGFMGLFIDVPDANQEGIHWVQQRGMEEVFGCERMYYSEAPEIDHSKIFGVSTLEIG